MSSAEMTTTGSKIERARGAGRSWPLPQVQNVNSLERWVCGIGGAALVAEGLRRRDLTGLAAAVVGGSLFWRGATGYCAVYQGLGISTAEEGHGQGPSSSIPPQAGVKVEQTFTINRPAGELYRFWRNFENLPRFMRHLEAVKVTGDKTSHWVARGPLGITAAWDAEIINERENEMIAWRSLEGSEVDTAGSIHFRPAPGNRGTEVRVSLKYNPPAGIVGARIAKLFGRSPESMIREDLRRFKQLMEAGEIATTTGQPSGRAS